MDNPICKKVTSMLSMYIENKLEEKDKLLIENHFMFCSDCYQKYLEMKNIMENLHLEYKKMLNEFERIEANKMFNIREYEVFYQNISPYIDDELCYDDSIKFRKYLLKSKPARAELATAYGLKNNIRHSIAMYKDNLNINFSKNIIKKLKEETKDSFDNVYKRAGIVLAFMVFSLILGTFYMGYNYLNQSVAKETAEIPNNTVEFPQNDDELIEFTFEDNSEPLLTAK